MRKRDGVAKNASPELTPAPIDSNGASDRDATLDTSAAAALSAAERASEAQSIGSYQLIRKLGEGGMGQVWLAEQTEPIHRQVALKLIKVGRYDDSVLQRFYAERQSLAMMDHPAIAKVFEAGATPDGQPYFVMEYVRGQPITDYCDRKRLKIRERLELFIKVCEGVQHAHQKAVMHRDLKPANILVVEVDDKPVPRIIDFGLAKAASPQFDGETLVTQAGGWVGTPGYMSPEQADPGVMDVDMRTDVYSLGAVLYVLLTGFLPFETKDWRKQRFDEFLRRLHEEDPPRPSAKVRADKESSQSTAEARAAEPKQLVSLLSGDLDWITMKALEKDRARRYGTPTELAADIDRYLNNEPILARPASRGYRLRKYVRRHRVSVAVAVGLVLLLAGFAVIQAVQVRRITRERDRANRITDFMRRMFKVSDPSEARGNSITAREILDKASQEIETGLTNDPETQAQLMKLMGNVYESLGLYPRAQPLLERAVGNDRRVLGPKNPETLKAMDDLAYLLTKEGRYAEAEKLERTTVELSRQVLGREHPQTLMAVHHLANFLMYEGHYPEAEGLAREALDIQRRVLGTEHAETLGTMSSLAAILEKTGHYAEAEKLFREELDGERRVLGPEHPDTLGTIYNLGETLYAEARYAEAEKLDRELLDIRVRVLGPEHPDTLFAIQDLAATLSAEERYAEAEKLAHEVLDARRRLLGPDHPDTLSAIGTLAFAVEHQGRQLEAEKLLREQLDGERRVLGPSHPTTLATTWSLAQSLENERRYVEAEKLLRDLLESQRRVLGAEHPDTLWTMDSLSATLAHEGRLAEAEKLEREVFDIRRRVLGPEDSSTAASLYNLGCFAARRGSKEEALALVREAVDHGLDSNNDLGIDKDDDLKSLHGDPRFDALVAHAKEVGQSKTAHAKNRN